MSRDRLRFLLLCAASGAGLHLVIVLVRWAPLLPRIVESPREALPAVLMVLSGALGGAFAGVVFALLEPFVGGRGFFWGMILGICLVSAYAVPVLLGAALFAGESIEPRDLPFLIGFLVMLGAAFALGFSKE